MCAVSMLEYPFSTVTDIVTEPSSPDATELSRAAINAETAKIPWSELQRFFAAGRVLWVAPDIDLVDVAWRMAQDHADEFNQLLEAGQVAKVTDRQALAWHEDDSLVWAVTVAPWVLVQEKSDSE